MDLTRLLRLSIKEQASDLHLSAGLPPILRVDGDMIRTDLPVLLPSQVESLVHEVLNDTQIKALKDGIEIDFSFEIPEIARLPENPKQSQTNTENPRHAQTCTDKLRQA